MKTWSDLEEIAIGNPWTSETPRTFITGEPLVMSTLTAVEMGKATREEALIQLVFALIEVKNKQHEMMMDYLNTRPMGPFLIPER